MITTRSDPLQAATLRRMWLASVKRPFTNLYRKYLKILEKDAEALHTVAREGVPEFHTELSRNWVSGIPLAAEHGIQRVFRDAQRLRNVPAFNRPDLFHESKRLFVHIVKHRPSWIKKKNLLEGYLLREATSLSGEVMARVEKSLANSILTPSGTTRAQAVKKQLKLVVNKTLAEADTQLTRVHAEAQLEALRELGFDKLRIGVEWTINEDACDLCQPLAGIVVTIDEAEGMIPRHYNCRCVWLPCEGDEGEHEGQIRDPQDIRDVIKESKEEEENNRGDTAWNPSRIYRRKPL